MLKDHIKQLPVFYDPSGKRWKIFVGIVDTILFVSVVIFSTLFFTILSNPKLPQVVFKGESEVGTVCTPEEVEYLQKTSSVSLASARELLNKYYSSNVANNVSKPDHKVLAYYSHSGQKSLASLQQNVDKIDVLFTEWLDFSESTESAQLVDGSEEKRVADIVEIYSPTTEIVPVLSNFLYTEKKQSGEILTNAVPQRLNVAELLNYVELSGLDGLALDFTTLKIGYGENLYTFSEELFLQFKEAGIPLYVIFPSSESIDELKKISNLSDFVVYSMYSSYLPVSASLSSQSIYEEGLRKVYETVPPEKLFIGIGNYGQEWYPSQTYLELVDFQTLISNASSTGNGILFDPISKNPYFYYSKGGESRTVWFLDSVTAYNQVLSAQSYKPKGYMLWKLGYEDPLTWEVLTSEKLDEELIDSLKKLQFGYGIEYSGSGEFIKVISYPSLGQRQLEIDLATKYIKSEQIEGCFSPYVIGRWGQKEKKIALTFDDGPTVEWTPRVLDILEEYDVPATFFVIGFQADLNRGILKRMYEEGHEIGGHTFTHPNVATIPEEILELELNATERVFESILKRQSVLFRPPYGVDSEPQTPREVDTLLSIGRLGYLTVGMHIDPGDWMSPGVDKIVERTIDAAKTGMGNVVLLHDGGGNRSQTIKALPKIIEGLKQEGFEIVPLSSLIDLSRDDVMPPIQPEEQVQLGVTDTGFLLSSVLFNAVKYTFWIGTTLGILRIILIIILAWFEKRRMKKRVFSDEHLPKVSVLIPAWNEENVIVKTVETLLKSDYPSFDVIVIENGSSDNTYEVARKAFEGNPQVKVYSADVKGKAVAMDYGAQRSDSEVLITQDADTLLPPDAIRKLARRFVDKSVGAVAGNVKVGNKVNILTKLQALEYIISQNLDRRAMDFLNSITVVPGAIGAWRRSLVIEAGGFTSNTLAEDAELTLRILERGYRVEYEEEALAYTEAPATVKSMLKQRFRWVYGTTQSIFKHVKVLFNKKYGFLGFVAIPHVLIFQILFPLIAPILDIFTVLFTAVALFQAKTHIDFALEGVYAVLMYFCLFLLLDVFIALFAFAMEKTADRSLIIWLPVQRLAYRPILYISTVKSILSAIKGPLVGWEKIKRENTAKLEESVTTIV